MSSPIFITLTFTFTILFLASPASSLSRKELTAAIPGFRVELKHIDSEKNLTKLEHILLGVQRRNQRLQSLYTMAVLDSSSGLRAPVHAGNGEFLMSLSIGTPPLSYDAILDTGSDLIWTQCMPCNQCFEQPTPIYDPKKSSTFSRVACSSDLCTALPDSSCTSNLCHYAYTYGDYSATEGVIGQESFTFNKVKVGGIGFGCGSDNQGQGFSQGSGLVGFGRGPVSLVSQLDQKKFAYCLTSIEDTKSTGSLFTGNLVNQLTRSRTTITTPLVKNPSQPSFYYLDLQGITVGETRLPIKQSTFSLQRDGTGGLIIDSGTTITYLEETAFDLVKQEFTRQIKLDVEDSGTIGLDLCFQQPKDDSHILTVPRLTFHFKGADLELPMENYVVLASGVLCLAMSSSSGMSILGNIQQQNLLVVHDIEQETLSFSPMQCNTL